MKNIMKIAKYIGIGVFVALICLLVVQSITTKQTVLGSTITGSEYYSTSTGTQNPMLGVQDGNSATYSGVSLLKNGQGAVAQVTVTGVSAAGSEGANIEFYDATTTDVSKRTGNIATSSLFLFALRSQQAVGTYTYDVQLRFGLTAVNRGGVSQASSTITYR